MICDEVWSLAQFVVFGNVRKFYHQTRTIISILPFTL